MGNKMADWRKLVSNIAPGIAAILPPPFNVFGAAAIKAALSLKSDSNDDDISAALINATPEQIASIKQAENNFQIQLKQLDIDLEKINSDDRDSAREREKSVKDNANIVLAALAVIGFFSTLFYIIVYGLPDQGREPLLVLLGTLGGIVTQVFNYYFGSSSGSAQKNLLLARK